MVPPFAPLGFQRDPSHAMRASLAERALLGVATWSSQNLGVWRGPVSCSGRFEDWTVMDKLRFMVKCQDPVVVPPRGLSGHFGHPGDPPALPDGFTVERRLTLGAAGDVMRSEVLPASGDVLYGGLAADLFDADLVFANLEAPVTRSSTVPLRFASNVAPPLGIDRTTFDVLRGVSGRRYDVLSTANNHILDYGAEGLTRTLDALDASGIRAVGTNASPLDRQRGVIVERNGITVGFVGATFGLNGHAVPEGGEHLVNVVPLTQRRGPINTALLEAQIRWLRSRKVDVVVASLHWGMEYECYPTERQVELAHALVEQGVDVVLGHHAHVVQPIEYYRPQSDPERCGVICYCLGNLVNPFTAPYLALSLVVRIGLCVGQLRGRRRTFVARVEAVPTFQEIRGVPGNAHLRLHRLQHAMYDPNLSRAQRDNARASCRYADLVLGEGWRS